MDVGDDPVPIVIHLWSPLSMDILLLFGVTKRVDNIMVNAKVWNKVIFIMFFFGFERCIQLVLEARLGLGHMALRVRDISILAKMWNCIVAWVFLLLLIWTL